MTTRNTLEDIEQRFDELRNDLLGPWGEGRWGGAFSMDVPRMPPCDLQEEPDAYALTLELPGIDKDEVQLEVDEHGAHVRAEHREEREGERRGYLRRERQERAFERYVRFPREVSPDGARATFRNGVLEIRVPKVAPEKRNARHIDVT